MLRPSTNKAETPRMTPRRFFCQRGFHQQEAPLVACAWCGNTSRCLLIHVASNLTNYRSLIFESSCLTPLQPRRGGEFSSWLQSSCWSCCLTCKCMRFFPLWPSWKIVTSCKGDAGSNLAQRSVPPKMADGWRSSCDRGETTIATPCAQLHCSCLQQPGGRGFFTSILYPFAEATIAVSPLLTIAGKNDQSEVSRRAIVLIAWGNYRFIMGVKLLSLAMGSRKEEFESQDESGAGPLIPVPVITQQRRGIPSGEPSALVMMRLFGWLTCGSSRLCGGRCRGSAADCQLPFAKCKRLKGEN